MAKAGSASLTISFDDQAGTPRDLTPYVTSINGVEPESIAEEISSFGDEYARYLPVGFEKIAPIVITGYYDDTATSGPHVVLRALDKSPAQASRTLAINHSGTGGIFTVEAFCLKYKITGKLTGVTTFEATLQPTGEYAWS